LHAINEYAFENSPYPVIISIENHCSLKVQKLMADEFKAVFGSKLLNDFINPNENALPSPEQLKYKIILKVHSIYLLLV
jgi:hypothetical protein